ncbi:hypothetical protein H5T87_01955 [bacterium]|nr:hypothetical protein [bacterium]
MPIGGSVTANSGFDAKTLKKVNEKEKGKGKDNSHFQIRCLAHSLTLIEAKIT